LPNKKIDSAGTGALVDHEADSAAQRLHSKMDYH
jgi:protein-tyrosine-phosphatase